MWQNWLRSTAIAAASTILLGVGAASADPPDAGTVDLEVASLFAYGVRGPTLKDAQAREAAAAIELALGWLTAHQAAQGMWPADKLHWCNGKEETVAPDGPGGAQYTVGVTGMALAAYLGAGYGPQGSSVHSAAVRKGLLYLLSIQDAEGCVGPRGEQSYLYSHAFATLALVEGAEATGSLPLLEAAQRAIDFLHLARNPGAAWRYGVKPADNDVSMAGCCCAPLLLARRLGEAARAADLMEPLIVDDVALVDARSYIDRMTDPSTGRLGYVTRGTGSARTMEMIDRFPGEKTEALTALAVFLRQTCPGGDPKADADLQSKGLGLILDVLPNWDPANGSIDMYYWYYAALVAATIGGKSGETIALALHHALIPNQRRDTDPCRYQGSWDPAGPWGPDGGRMYSTAIAVLTLTAPARVAPLPADRRDLLEALPRAAQNAPERARLIRGLGLYAVPGADGAILAASKDPDVAVRVAAAQALGAKRGTTGAAELVRGLGDLSGAVRAACADALARKGALVPAATGALQTALADPELAVRVAAARALGRMGEGTSTEQLKPLLAAQEWELRVAAAGALMALDSDLEAADAVLVASLSSTDVSQRREAAMEVSRHAARALPSRAAGIGRLGDEDALVRYYAARAALVATPGAEQAVEALASCLGAQPLTLRRDALNALAQQGAAAAPAAAQLGAMVVAGPLTLRASAIELVAKIGRKGSAALVGLWYVTAHGPPQLRRPARDAIRAMELTALESVMALAPQLPSDQEVIARGAQEGLAQLGEAAVPALLQHLDAAKEETVVRALTVVARLGVVSTPATSRLVQLLDASPSATVRAWTAHTLAEISPHSVPAEEALVRRLEDVEPGVQDHALRALGAIAAHSDTALRTVLDWADAQDPKKERLRIVAIEGLATVGPRAERGLSGLLRCLREKEGAGVWSAAVKTLGALGEIALEELIAALGNTQDSVSSGAAQALRVMGPEAKKAVDALIEVIVRRRTTYSAASDALVAIGKSSVRPLTKLLDHSDSWERTVAAGALGRIGPDAKGALKKLRALSRDSDAGLAAAAQQAITQISGR